MLKQWAYKLRLKPNERQARLMAQFAGCQRVIWNHTLAHQKQRLDDKQGLLSIGNTRSGIRQVYYQLREEKPYLKEAPQESADHTLNYQLQALMDAFDPENVRRFPHFKPKGRKESFKYALTEAHQRRLDQVNHRIRLPKVGWVRYFKNRPVEGMIKAVTVSYKAGHWYVSLQVELDIPDPIHPSTAEVGIDVGVKRMAVCSDGQIFPAIDSFEHHHKRLKRAQRQLARKVGPNKATGQKASKNWKKQQKTLQRINQKIANSRKDYTHKVSAAITPKYKLIVVEDIKVSNLTASAKGSLEQPGKHVRQKAGLNRVIHGQNWYEFRRQLEYKQRWLGGEFRAVQPNNTSRTCNKCKHMNKENRKTRACFECINCGHTAHADVNAAQNILEAG